MLALRPRTALAPRPSGVITCPFNGHQTGWCRGLCRPLGGLGACGRLAPHALRSRYQEAIAAASGVVLEGTAARS